MLLVFFLTTTSQMSHPITFNRLFPPSAFALRASAFALRAMADKMADR